MSFLIKPKRPIINWNNPLTKGLVFDSPFFEGAGTQPIELISNAKGSFINTPTWQTGIYGKEINIGSAGSTNGISYTLNSRQTNVSQFSIEQIYYVPAGLIHWYNPWYLGPESNGGAGGRAYVEVNGNPGVTLGFVVNAATSGGFSIPIPATGLYHHQIITYDFTNLATAPKWYLDGISQTVTTATTPSGAMPSDNNVFTVGNDNVPGTDAEGWPGPIVYTRFWNRILNPQEARQLYTNPWQIYKRQGFYQPLNSISTTATIALDAVTNAVTSAGATGGVSTTHTCTGSNLILIVALTMDDSNENAHATTSVTYNSVSMTNLCIANNASEERVELWYLLNPPTGSAYTVQVNVAYISYVGIGAMSFTGVSQSAPTIYNTYTNTSGASPSLSLTTTVNNSWIIDAVEAQSVETVDTGQTLLWQNQGQSYQNGGSSAYEGVSPAGSKTVGWGNTGGNGVAYAAMVIAPATSGNSYTKTFTDSLTLTETFIKEPMKVFSDSVSLVETFLKQPQKLFTEAALTLTETFIKQAQKVFSELLTVGYALQFDGSQNYVSLGTMGNFGSQLGSGLYWSFLIKTTSTALGEFGYYSTGGTGIIIGLNENGGGTNSNGYMRVILEATSSSTVSGTTAGATSPAFNDGNIHLVVITVNPSTNTLTIKIDGVAQSISYQAQNTPTGFSNFTSPIILGARYYNGSVGNNFACTLDNVLLGTSSSALYGNYIFSEGSGTTTADSSGNANTGTLTGSPVPAWVRGLTSPFDSLIKQATKALSETISLTETLAKQTTKVFVETTLSLTETFSYIHEHFLSFTDSVSLSDSIIKLTTKALSETMSLTETFVRATTKVFTNTLTLTETMVKQTNKFFTETALSLTEAFSTLHGHYLSFVDNLTLTESITRNITKVFSDSVSLTEKFIRSTTKVFTETTLSLTETFAIVKTLLISLTDSLTLTETFTKLTTKALTETATLTESFIRYTTKAFTDSVTLAETFSKQLQKVFSESALSLSDTITKLTTKVLTETLSLIEIFTHIATLFRTFTDTINPTDTLTKLTSRTLFESVSLIDTLVKQTAKIFIEAVTLTETLIKQAQKVFSDSVSLSEVFSKVTTYIMSFLDTINPTDSITKFTSKIFIETQLSLTETFITIRQYFRTFTDSLSLTETFSTVRAKVFTDTISLVENFKYYVTRLRPYKKLHGLYTYIGRLYNKNPGDQYN